MIYPIYIYGQPVLRKEAQDIDPENYPNLSQLIEDMFETMYNAEGIGLAAPQIGLSDRIFVVDLSPLSDDVPEYATFKHAFINAHIIERSGDECLMDEGCLSIPGIHEKVARKETIRMSYLDENLQCHEEEFSGFAARCIQHEYDHIDGILFTDKIAPIRRRMIKNKLTNMEKGNVNTSYRIKTL